MQIPLYNISALDSMRPILLSEMQSIKLMNRVDTKFAANINLLPEIIRLASDSYRVQVVNGLPVSSYDSVYFDTSDIDMYLKHHNRKLKRQKIRTRRYVDSDLNFLEIKNKTNKGRTHKLRIEIGNSDFKDFSENKSAIDFINNEAHYEHSDLIPHLQSAFSRITLVNNEKTERLTIDTNLYFQNIQTSSSVSLPNLMVIELKQDGVYNSQMKQILQKLRVKPVSISKYCIGMSLTTPSIKNNRFKNKLYYITEKI